MKHALLLMLAGFLAVPLNADPPRIHTNRTSPKLLPLPKGDDVFHFIVFGDRTGGPAEGIKILAQAVEDANLLDPDLVMTVGDLVNGYNQTREWMAQMEEFHATMNQLKMPWFPVAGNHDIYWRRSASNPEDKPPREHEDHYEKHFGPLWYWFEHKNTGFLILFSDEAHPDGRPRDFGDRAQQKISSTQLAWIGSALEEMKQLQHIFVFLHHPFWWGERYPGNNWDNVHELLVKNGNVRAVLAGHIHQMRYDGRRDGIDYYALATTGGSLTPGMEYRYFGLLHHFNVVTVRDSGYSMASIPVGGVFDPKQFDAARWAEVDAARYLLHQFVSPPIPLNLDGSSSAICQIALTNPCALPIDLTLLGTGDKNWRILPEHRHAKLAPGQGRVFEFACVREPTESLQDYQAPEFELRFDVLTSDMRLVMPNRSIRAQTALVEPGGWPKPPHASFFEFDGKAACLEIPRDRFPQPDGPFTVEAWIRPDNDTDGGLISNLLRGGFGLEIRDTPRFSVHAGGRVVTAGDSQPLPPGQWTHLAGVYDGTQILLFVNGRQAASAPAPGSLAASDKSLYIGARPNGAWNVYNFSYPAGFWRGAIDDVRLSHGALYTTEFQPIRTLAHDSSTTFALPNDIHFGPFVAAIGPAAIQAMIHGQVTLARSPDPAPTAAALRESLTFHASYDNGLDADVAKGDKRLHTILNQNPFEARIGLHAAGMTRVAPGQGLVGDALQFTQRDARWLFYPAEENVPYNPTNWSGTVSMWLRLDPEEDLAPGYCDPIQITPRAWNDAAFFVDFDKEGDPRDFRLGAFPDLNVWNPDGKSMNDLPEEVRPLLKVKTPPFGRDQWTHVAFTWQNFNTGRKDGLAILYLNGKAQGELTGWTQTHTWAGQPSRLMIGLNYIGLFDELSCFDRALTEAEIRQLFAARGRLDP